MCRGLVEELELEVGRGRVSCELCSLRAAVYCQADDAYLCRDCDKRVHGANFLALRHIRCILCNTCHNLTQRYLVGSSSVEVVLPSIASLSCESRIEQKCVSSRDLIKRPFLLL